MGADALALRAVAVVCSAVLEPEAAVGAVHSNLKLEPRWLRDKKAIDFCRVSTVQVADEPQLTLILYRSPSLSVVPS